MLFASQTWTKDGKGMRQWRIHISGHFAVFCSLCFKWSNLAMGSGVSSYEVPDASAVQRLSDDDLEQAEALLERVQWLLGSTDLNCLFLFWIVFFLNVHSISLCHHPNTRKTEANVEIPGVFSTHLQAHRPGTRTAKCRSLACRCSSEVIREDSGPGWINFRAWGGWARVGLMSPLQASKVYIIQPNEPR